MSHASASKAFRECVMKAGYTRRVWINLMRHVSCTEDSVRGMPESYRKYKHHWSPSSRMPAVYEHLSQAIIPKIQSESWRIFTGEEKVVQLDEKPVQLVRSCGRCGFDNPRDFRFCSRCANPLDFQTSLNMEQTRMQAESIIQQLANDPDKMEKLAKLLE
jgi:hypothetical protein